MSTTPFPGPYPTTITNILVHHITTTPTSRRAKTASQVLRRRPTPQQGRALEILGHAIEYLVDSRLYANPAAPNSRPADTEAAQTLMRLSRQVFAECPQAAPIRQRLRRLLRLFT